MTDQPPQLRLEPWSDADLPILERSNAPEMTEFLGGPETPEQVAKRHRRYQELDGGGMFRVVLAATGETVGSIGYWTLTWEGEQAYETGWSVFPEFQGRGIAAAAAVAVIAHAAEHGEHAYLHAFPKVEHAASNAVCRRAGFELRGECALEYPKGNPITSNDWRVDLAALRAGRPSIA